MNSKIKIFMIMALALCPSAWASFTPAPLDAVANRDLADETSGGTGKGGWTDQGHDNCLDKFPRGKIELEGIPFQIPEKGNAAIMFKGKKTSAVFPNLAKEATIKVPPGAKGSSFYVLAVSVWGSPDQVEAANLAVKYANGATDSYSMVFGSHVANWWEPKELVKSVVAWRGTNGGGNPVGVYLIPYTPKKTVDSDLSEIKITANDQTDASLAVIGITVGDKKAKDILPPPMGWRPWEDNGTEGWFTMPMKYDDAAQPAAWEDALDFFKQPAGSFGWTVANGENLEFEKAPGKPVRFKGIVTTGEGFYPYVADAEKEAKILKKYGFNQVRFHSLFDVLLVQKGGYVIPELNPARMAKFDKYFSALKEQGIYVKISGCFTARWAQETGVDAFDKIEPLNNTQYTFDKKHQELYLQALKLFLEHVNPYTKLRYADDPAFNMYKIVNESSLFFNQTTALPGVYAVRFQDKYNQWLKQKYGADARLMEAWRVKGTPAPLSEAEKLSQGTIALLSNFDLAHCAAANKKRAVDQAEFYYETERAWFEKVRQAIRDSGGKMLVEGSSWGGPGYLQEIQSAVNANFDFTGKHTYWLHPKGGWTPELALFPNEPVVKHADNNFLQCVFEHVAGKPFAITEWNFCFPNDYTLDAAPVMAAYGALQNVVANHRFCMGAPEMGASKRDFFSVFNSPAGVAVEPLAYFMYVRGDVKPAPVIYENEISPEKLFDPDRKKNIRQTNSGNRFFMAFDPQEVPNEALLAGGVRISLDGGKYPALRDEMALKKCLNETEKTVTSVTDELVWNYGDGNILVRTPKTRAFIGFTGGKEYENGPLKMKISPAYAVIGFSSLDDKSLGESAKILVTVAGRDRNTGQSLDALMQGGKRVEQYESFKMHSVGGPPLIFEPVELGFSLKTSVSGKWSVLPLDLAGRPLQDMKTSLNLDHGILSGNLSNKSSAALNFIVSAEGQ